MMCVGVLCGVTACGRDNNANNAADGTTKDENMNDATNGTNDKDGDGIVDDAGDDVTDGVDKVTDDLTDDNAPQKDNLNDRNTNNKDVNDTATDKDNTTDK